MEDMDDVVDAEHTPLALDSPTSGRIIGLSTSKRERAASKVLSVSRSNTKLQPKRGSSFYARFPDEDEGDEEDSASLDDSTPRRRMGSGSTTATRRNKAAAAGAAPTAEGPRRSTPRGEWSAAEEAILARKHMELGNKWTTISNFLPARSDNDVKNIWHSTLRSKNSDRRSFLRTYARAVHDCTHDAEARRQAYDMAQRMCGAPAPLELALAAVQQQFVLAQQQQQQQEQQQSGAGLGPNDEPLLETAYSNSSDQAQQQQQGQGLGLVLEQEERDAWGLGLGGGGMGLRVVRSEAQERLPAPLLLPSRLSLEGLPCLERPRPAAGPAGGSSSRTNSVAGEAHGAGTMGLTSPAPSPIPDRLLRMAPGPAPCPSPLDALDAAAAAAGGLRAYQSLLRLDPSGRSLLQPPPFPPPSAASSDASLPPSSRTSRELDSSCLARLSTLQLADQLQRQQLLQQHQQQQQQQQLHHQQQRHLSQQQQQQQMYPQQQQQQQMMYPHQQQQQGPVLGLGGGRGGGGGAAAVDLLASCTSHSSSELLLGLALQHQQQSRGGGGGGVLTHPQGSSDGSLHTSANTLPGGTIGCQQQQQQSQPHPPQNRSADGRGSSSGFMPAPPLRVSLPCHGQGQQQQQQQPHAASVSNLVPTGASINGGDGGGDLDDLLGLGLELTQEELGLLAAQGAPQGALGQLGGVTEGAGAHAAAANRALGLGPRALQQQSQLPGSCSLGQGLTTSGCSLPGGYGRPTGPLSGPAATLCANPLQQQHSVQTLLQYPPQQQHLQQPQHQQQQQQLGVLDALLPDLLDPSNQLCQLPHQLLLPPAGRMPLLQPPHHRLAMQHHHPHAQLLQQQQQLQQLQSHSMQQQQQQYAEDVLGLDPLPRSAGGCFRSGGLEAVVGSSGSGRRSGLLAAAAPNAHVAGLACTPQQDFPSLASCGSTFDLLASGQQPFLDATRSHPGLPSGAGGGPGLTAGPGAAPGAGSNPSSGLLSPLGVGLGTGYPAPRSASRLTPHGGGGAAAFPAGWDSGLLHMAGGSSGGMLGCAAGGGGGGSARTLSSPVPFCGEVAQAARLHGGSGMPGGGGVPGGGLTVPGFAPLMSSCGELGGGGCGGVGAAGHRGSGLVVQDMPSLAAPDAVDVVTMGLDSGDLLDCMEYEAAGAAGRDGRVGAGAGAEAEVGSLDMLPRAALGAAGQLPPRLQQGAQAQAEQQQQQLGGTDMGLGSGPACPTSFWQGSSSMPPGSARRLGPMLRL